MATDAFIQIQGCDGESTDKNHSNWIEIQNFNWDVAQPSLTTASTAGSRTSQRVTVAPFTFTQVLDAAYPKLLTNCCKGSHIPKATVQLTRATGSGNSQVYMQFTMSDLVVSGINVLPGQDDGTLPMAQVELTFGKIEWQYTQLDHKTGAAGGNVTANYDLVTNTCS